MIELEESKAIVIKHPACFEADLTPEEELVAKSILCSKAMFGLEVRLAKPEVFFLIEGNSGEYNKDLCL